MTEYQNMEMHAAVSRRGKMFQKKSQEKRGKMLQVEIGLRRH